MEQLKPCPFCGGEAYMKMRRVNAGPGRSWYACCSKCYARTDGYEEPYGIEDSTNPLAVLEKTIADAAELWNARVQEQAPNTAPVVHGYWIGTSYDGYAEGNPVYDEWECSECGWEHKGEDTPSYCQHCGARMDADAPTCGPDDCELEADDE